MHSDLKEKYNEFLSATGTVVARLNHIGLNVPYLSPGTKIDNIEDFQDVLNSAYVKKEEMVDILKKCFKNHLFRSDIIHLLKNGDEPFSDFEINESFNILPVDSEGGISVDDFIEFLYKI